MTERPFAYICSPFRGDIELNTKRAWGYCRQAYLAGYTPLAGHLLFPQFLDDAKSEEREAGLQMGLALLPQCAVLVVCGSDITEGMAREVALAQALGIECTSLENMPIIPKEKVSLLEQVQAAKGNYASALQKHTPGRKSHGHEL